MTVGDVKQRQRQAWAAGDYRTAGARIQIVSEMLCEAVDLRGVQTVLDVATGTGNTAIAAARRWCEVAVPLRNWFPLHKGRNLQAFAARKIICGSFSEIASPWRSSPSTSSSAIVHRPIGSKYFRPHSVQL